MKIRKKFLFRGLIFVSFSILFFTPANAEYKPNIGDTEIQNQSNDEPMNNYNLRNRQEFQPIKLEINNTKLKPFPVLLRDSINSYSGGFNNYHTGDYGQKLILEFRINF
ncbi:exported hypothetical protein [Hyella patelloides LEGE 07179]|uniref:Uncharacterized protein n=1 Tax=Hyella patelloides LEGE 07179 TaxID=945734 RepID=A0A563VKU0_9CYAN|nr:hypothetical protein [Hyella patelloides]VEP11925.1 exported hypothetical protein [Hyella patelloides LEGE 07179]